MVMVQSAPTTPQALLKTNDEIARLFRLEIFVIETPTTPCPSNFDGPYVSMYLSKCYRASDGLFDNGTKLIETRGGRFSASSALRTET